MHAGQLCSTRAVIKPQSSGPDGPFLAQSLASRAPASEFSDARATKEAPMEAREPTSRSSLRCAAWQAFQQLPGGPGSEERLIASPPGRPSSLVPSAEPGAHAKQSSKREGERACRVLSPGATHVSLVFVQHNNAMLQQIPSSTGARGARVLLTLPNPCKFELRRATDTGCAAASARSR